ncbi:MAG: hypothetical protein P4L43_16675 [Syntrophobacteraceae bacterium]|nr:hypothetical protein [Syntrophobacteraceae bacterium]
MAVLNLDLADYDPVESGWAPVPPGDYEVRIVNSSLKQGLAPQGFFPEARPCPQGHSTASDPPGPPSGKSFKIAEFEYVILGPVCRGVRLRDSFTLTDGASLCRMKTLAVAARCTNPDFIGDTEELHGLRCRVRVERIGALRSSGCKNMISGYMYSGSQSQFSGTPPRSARDLTQRTNLPGNLAPPVCEADQRPLVVVSARKLQKP